MTITTQHISLGLLALTCLILGWGLGLSCNNNVKKDKLIDSYKDSILISKERIRVLEEQEGFIQKELDNTYLQISKKDREITKLKNKLREKIDSVGNLDNKQSLEYITKWLSKGSNSR
jgi:uncharacterized coiled-coil protein SlyX